jgi:rhodanese-related sulfurtransferase
MSQFGKSFLSCLAGIATVLVLAMAPFRSATAQQHPAPLASAPETSADRLNAELGKKRVLVIDVRSPGEFAEGHIPGALNIPLEDLRKKVAELKIPKDTPIITVCDHGGRSSRAVLELQKLGYRSTSFCKFDTWKKRGFKTQQESRGSRGSSRVSSFSGRDYLLSYIGTANLQAV